MSACPQRARALSFVLALGVPTALTTTTLAQEHRALFDAPVIVADSEVRFALTLDYDQDGYEDAISYWWDDDTGDHMQLAVWINDGTGELVRTFSGGIAGSWPGEGTNARVRFYETDLDGDPYPDFFGIFTHDARGSLFAWSSGHDTHPGSPTLMSWSEYNGAIHAAVYADFTLEGQMDRAMLVGQRLMIHRITVHPDGSGNGTVTTWLELGPGLDTMIAADWNSDGVTDLYVNQGRLAHLITVDSNGQASVLQTIDHGVTGMVMPTMGDVDGDEDLDIVIFDVDQYTLLRRTGQASFDLESPVAGGPATHLFDVDMDGDLDGLCCGGTPTQPDPEHNTTPSMYRVALNDGFGSFAPAFEIPGLGSDRLAGAADLDHDGDVELIAGRCVYYPTAPIAAAPMPRFATAVQDRAACDFDLDGDPDLGLGLGQVRRNLGNANFEALELLQTAPPAGARFEGPGFPGDFDGDGDRDLIVALVSEANGSFLSMRRLMNQGGGSFVDAGDAGAPGVDFNLTSVGANLPESSLVADADGDGDLDLLLRTLESPARSRIWWNDGAGYFGDETSFNGEVIHHVADLSGDGLPDLVVAREHWQIRFGIGAQAFGPREDELGRCDPHLDRIACDDLDADGDVDLVVTYRFSSNVQLTVLWNDGAGNLSWEALPGVRLHNDEQTAGQPKLVLARDLTGDGLLDIVLAPTRYAPGALTVVPRKPDNSGYEDEAGHFQQALFATSESTIELALGALLDFDGDGDTDIASDRLILGRTHQGPEAGLRLQSGAGLPAASGITPTLGASGPFRVGEPVLMRLTGAPPATTGILAARLESTPAPFSSGPHLGVSEGVVTSLIPITTDGVAGQAGTGSWTFPFEVPAYKAGRTYAYDVLLVDPDTGQRSVRANELRITYGD